MNARNIIDSFNSAIEGFIYVLKTQKNMRLHVVMGVVAFILGIFLGLDRIEMLILGISILFVLFAEMFNTCIEYTVDLINHTYHPLAKVIKDVAAGIVFLSSLNALIVGYFLFVTPIFSEKIKIGLESLSANSWYITFICIVVVIVTVVLLKLILHKGTPLRGGMPSGHAAVAFSLWVAASIVSKNEIVVFLVLILAILVAQSRVVKGVHSFIEVFVGAILGTLITLLIFQLLWL